jgi:hypothetical protein
MPNRYLIIFCLILIPAISTFSQKSSNKVSTNPTQKGIITINYSEFRSLYEKEQLKYPATYLINRRTSWKFQYTDKIGDGTSGGEEIGYGPYEPLLVETIDRGKINETTVKSTLNSRDIIYWRVHHQNEADYPLDAEGAIYYRKDAERNISMNCDWRYIQQYRWKHENGIYNVARKIDAKNPFDRELFYMISPFGKDNIIVRRGTPDNSNYQNSNIVIKKAGTFPAWTTTVKGSNELSYFAPNSLYDYVAYWAKPGDNIQHENLPTNTTITSISGQKIYVSNKALNDGTSTANISKDYYFPAVNYFTSATNLTVEGQFYDNRIHIVLASTFNDFFLNDGIIVSLSAFDEYSHNSFNELVLCKGSVLTKSNGTDLFGVEFLDTVKHHSFLSNIKNTTINPAYVVKGNTTSSNLIGEINGLGESIHFTDFDHFILDIEGKGNIGQVLTSSDAQGTAIWGQPAFEYTPISATDPNFLKGTVCFDKNYFYIKTSDNQSGTLHLWHRYAKSAW